MCYLLHRHTSFTASNATIPPLSLFDEAHALRCLYDPILADC
jgi:hypothetical protein